MDINIYTHTVSQHLNTFCIIARPFAKIAVTILHTFQYHIHIVYKSLSTQWKTKDLSDHHLWIGMLPTPVRIPRIWALAEFLLENQGVNRRDQCCKVVYVFEYKDIEAWKSFIFWRHCRQGKSSQSLQYVWEQFPNTQNVVELLSSRMIRQLDIKLTNVLHCT